MIIFIFPGCRRQEGDDQNVDIRVFEPITQEEQNFLLAVVKRSLDEYVASGEVPEIKKPVDMPRLLETRGVFVCLYRNSKLCGCVGRHISEAPVYNLVQQMTEAGGLENPCFNPVTRDELEEITIEIHVFLSEIVPIYSLQYYDVDKYGIVLQKFNKSATFLPNVAKEQGWDKIESLRNLSLKAGLEQDAWTEADARFYIYETQSFSADYTSITVR